jgi:hypothetical protein
VKRNIDLFLAREDSSGGKVIDINFIPDYLKLLKLERKRNEIIDVRKLITAKENSCKRRFFYPKIYKTEASIDKELERLENKLQHTTESPVYSSGHAFVCFDSLFSAYKCLSAFRERTWKKIGIRLDTIADSFKQRNIRRSATSTFGKFRDEELDIEMIDIGQVNILVDQMIEPQDIIWTNVGGEGRGVFICRRILCNILVISILLFLTTPTVNLIYLSFIVNVLCFKINGSFFSPRIYLGDKNSVWVYPKNLYPSFDSSGNKFMFN